MDHHNTICPYSLDYLQEVTIVAGILTKMLIQSKQKRNRQGARIANNSRLPVDFFPFRRHKSQPNFNPTPISTPPLLFTFRNSGSLPRLNISDLESSQRLSKSKDHPEHSKDLPKRKQVEKNDNCLRQSMLRLPPLHPWRKQKKLLKL